ncbi:MAG: prepilin-type N-terminal cleavage/methylation domain-containing protein [Minisyncoccota bacterium]
MVRGYTLIELIVAVGLFALVMLLSSGAYLVVIGVSRQAQGISTGIDNLSFALETMTRDIRTGSKYCNAGCTLNSFSFDNDSGVGTTYSRSMQLGPGGVMVGDIVRDTGLGPVPLTDPSVDVTSLLFYPAGVSAAPGDYEQARVTIIVSGSVSIGPGKPPQAFTVETGATMRGSDIAPAP